jgi:ubiquinone/menaquinone biosynthesis C-methylase UbiE
VPAVGWGPGPPTLRAAAAVGSGGAVPGLDIAAAMLEAAAPPTVPAGVGPIEWLQADAVEWSPPSPRFDVVLSRFGVMFFTDPARAFANLAAATRPGGRLAITTWARRDESPLFAVPLAVALDAMGRSDSGLPDDAGPFSLPDAETITAVLEPAGWSDVEVEVHHLHLPFGGGLDPATAAATTLDFGPTRIVTADLDTEGREKVVAAITDTLAGHVDEQGQVVLAGTVLVTTAAR